VERTPQEHAGAESAASDDGAHWSAIGLTNPRVRALAIDPVTPTTLYAGTDGGGVFKSANGGATWSTVNTDLTNTNVRALAIHPTTPTTLYAGTDGGGVFDLEQEVSQYQIYLPLVRRGQ
jgi:photosystem II stability/assembly factor-like uncharacterized protein